MPRFRRENGETFPPDAWSGFQGESRVESYQGREDAGGPGAEV